MRSAVILLAVYLIVYYEAAAQRKVRFARTVQFSLTPGLSTNGMHPGGYSNYFSLNFTSGYSAANYLLEIGVVSNLNENETRGLQFAGIANLTGANAFKGMSPKERDTKIKSGFEANLSGAQFSGIANVVLNNVFGWQTTGGVNVVKGALQGLQLAGISNTVYKYTFGIQLAGVYNVSVASMDGLQAAMLFNITQGELYGIQLGGYNKAGVIEGKNSYDTKAPTALQLGIINQAVKMNGFQVGIVNVAKRMQGTQIGLINIYHNGTVAQTRDGTSIGLINIGSGGYGAIYATEIFYTNIEIATGTIKNSRITSDAKEIQFQNTLIYSNEPGFIRRRQQWAFGYGIKKLYFNRSTQPGMGKFRFISYGIDWMHINHEHGKLTRELSLLTRPQLAFGSKLHPKIKSIYLFAAVSYNFYWTDTPPLEISFLESSTRIHKELLQMWPGFSAGVQIQ